MTMLIEVAYLVVIACQAPDFDLCRRLHIYEVGSQYYCQLARPIAVHIHQSELDNTKEWTFSRCVMESEILIDNTPE